MLTPRGPVTKWQHPCLPLATTCDATAHCSTRFPSFASFRLPLLGRARWAYSSVDSVAALHIETRY
ncbi:hypothetical protein GALMADRAFT_247357 [Galerina marginata CBS 339.88]|uniref:Uncharacterized protein n=1 Tax=Galerina marginata (strain CBS 339.88) TaxID=685588 RepID=A0A067SZ31_GALM3|nr:hypothetical protein GALMADRAFT_247357 [Galerina marginata CBS 339.88]